jgi:hypothetical protein
LPEQAKAEIEQAREPRNACLNKQKKYLGKQKTRKMLA